jgi:arsenite methyltransferase
MTGKKERIHMSHKSLSEVNALPDYKFDVPTHIQYGLLAALVIGVVGLILTIVMPADQRLFASGLLMIGLLAVIPTLGLFLVTNGHIRQAARRKMMQSVAWKGSEIVLDVGCGNGFLLLEAAKHLTTGKAIGIDIWQEGAGGQTFNRALRNAQLEGVADKVDVQNVDARQLPFDDESFDVIMSSLALHHMGSNANRDQALREMLRVLKPNGQIVLYDMFPMIGQAAALMQQQGLKQVQRSGFVLTVLSARK